MASIMKELMDIFYEETQHAGSNFERNMVFNLATSLTNNCHQKSSQEIYDFLLTTFTSNRARVDISVTEQSAWDDALLLVEIYFESKIT